MPRFFISFRNDSGTRYADHLCSSIEKEFGNGQAFMFSQPRGDFQPGLVKQRIKREILDCETFILVIDPHPEWVARLNDQADWVRFEIKESIENGKPSIPLMVGGATMPKREDLPDEIVKLLEWEGYSVPDESAIADFVIKLQMHGGDLAEYLTRLSRWLSFSDKFPGADAGFHITLKNQKQLDVLSLLKSQNASVIVGGPDSGKSTVLRLFARSLIGNTPTNSTRPIPVWVDLKRYQGAEPFEDYLKMWLASEASPPFYDVIHDALPDYMNRGEVLWLLDGLDSSSAQEYGSPRRRLFEFLKFHSQERYVVACRNLDDGLALSRSPIELSKLDDQQIDQFLRKTSDLKASHLKSRPDLLELCRNPFRLLMLVTYWRKNNQTLPPQLGHLYSEFLQDIIERADVPGLEVSPVLDMLSRIALMMAERDRNGMDIQVADLSSAGVLNPEDKGRLDYCLAGGLLEVGTKTGSILFVDHTFENFLAARALDAHLNSDGPIAIEKYLDNYVLREILANAVATSQDSSKLVDSIVNCALEKPQQIDRILSAAECIQHASPTVREMYGFKLLPQLREAASPYGGGEIARRKKSAMAKKSAKS